MFEILTKWELQWIHSLTDCATEEWDIFWTLITYFGEGGIFWITIALALLIPKKTRRIGLSMGIALLLGVVLGNGILKNLIARPRPYTADPSLHPRLAWGEMSGDFSFPSGHTLASFEAATVIFFYHRKWGIAALTLAFSVSLSRLFLAVHYPTDLLAGAVLGVCIGLFSCLFCRRILKKIQG